MNETERQLLATLRRYLSDIQAQSLRRRAQAAAGIAEGRLGPADLPRVRRQLESGIRLFVDAALQPALLREIESLGGGAARPASERHEVKDEGDVSVVRLRARELAVALGGTALGTQRAATAASELARNVVSYAGHGAVELVPAEVGAALTIRAIDQGPGIPDAELVLSGRYRSRTGLGKGLLGVKKLSTRFDLETGPSGTRVEAEIAL